MTLQMISYFVIMTAMSYFKYKGILCLTQIHGSNSGKLKLMLTLSSNAWFILFLTKLIVLNHICENVSAKVS